MRKRTQVFVSYSHADTKHLERLKVHLRLLEREGKLDLWSDTRIKTGQDWRTEIRATIDRASAAVLLISADFVASDFISTNELPPLLEAAKSEGVVMFPVYLKACRVPSEISRFHAVNPPSKPLIKMHSAYREDLWTKLARDIEGALQVECAGVLATGTSGAGVDQQSRSTEPPPLSLERDAKGFYVEKSTGRRVCGLCFERDGKTLTLLDGRKEGPSAAIVSGGRSSGYGSWTEFLRCPNCKTEYAHVRKSRTF